MLNNFYLTMKGNNDFEVMDEFDRLISKLNGLIRDKEKKAGYNETSKEK